MASSVQNSPRREVQQEGEPSPRSPRAQPEVERVARRVQNFVEITDHLLSIQGIRYVQREQGRYSRDDYHRGCLGMHHTFYLIRVIYFDGDVEKFLYAYRFSDIPTPKDDAAYESIEGYVRKVDEANQWLRNKDYEIIKNALQG